jgi:mediator of RNA polymerase II transcription subunit 12, fungi type
MAQRVTTYWTYFKKIMLPSHGLCGYCGSLVQMKRHVIVFPNINYLKVYHNNCQAGLRNKPSYNPTQYSIEWANVVTSYMKKQLADIGLPSAPRPGLNIKTTFKGVLSDADTRGRWISRFTYWYEIHQLFRSA